MATRSWWSRPVSSKARVKPCLCKRSGHEYPATDVDPLFDPEVMQDPYDYYRYLRENDPVHEIAGSGGAYLVTRADTIYDVVRKTEVFSPFRRIPPQRRLGDTCPASRAVRDTRPPPKKTAAAAVWPVPIRRPTRGNVRS